MKSAFLLNLTTVFYMLATMAYIIHIAFKSEQTGKAATIISYSGLLIHTIGFGWRWIESYEMGIGRVPLTNLYESMVFFAWAIMLMYLIFEYKYKIRSIGAFIVPLSFLAMLYVSIAPFTTNQIDPLMPALKSYWLFYHVLTAFLGYACFAISFIFALMYLMKAPREENPQAYKFALFFLSLSTLLLMTFLFDYLLQTFYLQSPRFYGASIFSPSIPVRIISGLLAVSVFITTWYFMDSKYHSFTKILPSVDKLDVLVYKSIIVGFPLLTAAIVLGAIWANEAWGTYWSWDPKETWSLITWFVYAAFLHARVTKGWRGRRTAIMAVIGFAAVIFTYLGVAFVLPGLHSYASPE